ncbi:MAG: DUF4302 domain-containing protein [Marinifilaceae bacterium]
MKRLLYVFMMLTILSSCDDDFEHTFDKTPTERKAEANENLASLLSDSEFGWKTTLIVGKEPIVGDFFVFKFDRSEGANDGIVTVANANGQADSEYAISHEAGTLLKFVTPNDVFFWLTNPDYREPVGYGADLEYIFMKEEDGKLYFSGKETKGQMVLEKAKESDWDMSALAAHHASFQETRTKNFHFLCITGGVEGTSEQNPLYIQIESPYYSQYFEEELKQKFYDFKYIFNGKRTRTNAATYIFTHDGIVFSDPLVLGQDTISNLVYNDDLKEWQIGNDGIKGKVLPSDLPMVATPGIVDLFIDDFFSREYCLALDPWGCKGPLANIMRDHLYSYDAPRLQRVNIKNKYVSPDGQDLGAGVVFRQSNDTDFAFLPLKMIKVGENHIKFERNGDVVTNIEGAEEKIANGTNIKAILDLVLEPQGWMIGCDVITLEGGSTHYDCVFYNVANPSNQIEYMGSFW